MLRFIAKMITCYYVIVFLFLFLSSSSSSCCFCSIHRTVVVFFFDGFDHTLEFFNWLNFLHFLQLSKSISYLRNLAHTNPSIIFTYLFFSSFVQTNVLSSKRRRIFNATLFEPKILFIHTNFLFLQHKNPFFDKYSTNHNWRFIYFLLLNSKSTDNQRANVYVWVCTANKNREWMNARRQIKERLILSTRINECERVC